MLWEQIHAGHGAGAAAGQGRWVAVPKQVPAPCQGPPLLPDPSGIPNQGWQLKGETTWKKKEKKIFGCLCFEEEGGRHSVPCAGQSRE